MDRPTVSVFLGLSLDGFIAGPAGELDFLSAVATDPPEDTGYDALMATCDAIAMGRNSYDKVATFDPWPYAGKRVIVLTGRDLAPRAGVERAHGDLATVLGALAAQQVRHVYLDGGDAVRQALRAELVDTLTLSWVPIVLGKGIKLFDETLPFSRWRLESGRHFPSGLVQARYRRA